ncbi:MAG: GGDEF domain-containing protein [Candidatus Acidiferrum sp.]
MVMETDNFGIGPRKRRAGPNSANDPSKLDFLKLKVASHGLLRSNAARATGRAKSAEVQNNFQTLLSESNREFAKLLREVRSKTNGREIVNTPNQMMSDLLMRAMRCAAQQYVLQAELGNLALTDELTGLYNRRGFMALGDRQLKLASRSGRGLLLFFVDVDGLKGVNDKLGHREGDQVLKETARALEKTFRDSDVVARMGGDEFAVLAIEASKHSESTIKVRLCEYVKAMNAAETRYRVSLSLGVARFDSTKRPSIVDLMVQADQAMYEQKRSRSGSQEETADVAQKVEQGALLDHHRASR